MPFKKLHQICGAIAMGMGCLVVQGWLWQMPPLLKMLPASGNTMKFNTALCFIVLGAVLFTAQVPGKWPQRWRLAASGFVLTLAGLTLFQYITGTNLGIDERVVLDRLSPANSGPPGRMSDQASLMFILSALGISLLEDRRHRWVGWAQACLIGAFWIALVGFLGYVLQASNFYRFLDQTSVIASNTVVTFLFVTVGGLSLAPRDGIIAVITSPYLGGRLCRVLIPLLLLLPLGISWLNLNLRLYGRLHPGQAEALIALLTSTVLVGVTWFIAWLLNQREAQLAEAARKTEEMNRRFYQIVMQAPFPMALHRSDGQFLELNPAWVSLSGYSLTETPTIFDWCQHVYAPDIEPEFRQRIQRMYDLPAGAEVADGEFVIYTKAGKAFIWDFYSSSFGPDSEGRALVLTTAMNVTEHRRYEEELRQFSASLEQAVAQRTAELVKIREELETAQQVAQVGSWSFEVATQAISWSAQMFRLFGLSPEEPAPTFIEHEAQIHPEDLVRWRHHVLAAIHEGIPYTLDFRIVWPDGSVHWLSGQGQPVIDEKGRVTHLIGTVLDITQRKEIELRLAQAEKRFRLLVEQLAGVVYVDPLNDSPEHRYISPQIKTLLGVEPEEWKSGFAHSWRQFVHPEDRDRVLKMVQEAWQKHQGYAVEYRMIHRDGRVLWVRDQAQFLIDPSENIPLMQGLAIDITPLKVAEANLQRQVATLNLRNREMQLLRQMSDFLQACHDLAEAAQVVSDYMPQLFPDSAGQISLLTGEAKETVTALLHWGTVLHTPSVFSAQDCWALRRGHPQLHLLGEQQSGPICRHFIGSHWQEHCLLCLPMTAFSEILGHFYLEVSRTEQGVCHEHYRLALTVSEQLSLAIANLQLREALRQESLHDPLTTLFNRRYLTEFIEQTLARSRRSGEAIGVLMIDIDHFKTFNDRFGHAVGDRVLQNVAAIILNQIRGCDVACRYGGEELVVVMPGATLAAATERAEQIRRAIAQEQLDIDGSLYGGLSVSIGVTAFPEVGPDMEALLQAADKALYMAKQSGRNCVVSTDAVS